MIDIRKHRIFLDGKAVAYAETPNKGGVIDPEGIILHDTAGHLKGTDSIDWLRDPRAKASAHVVIKRDGVITQLAPLNIRTWHAGISKWKGRSNVGTFTIGIEIVNPGRMFKFRDGYNNGSPAKPGVQIAGSLDVRQAATKQHGSGFWLQYTREQIEAVTQLCAAIVQTYGVTFIGTHWEISPGRKVDTNPLFPLEAVRQAALAARPVALIGDAGTDEIEDMRGDEDASSAALPAISNFRDEAETDAPKAAPHNTQSNEIEAVQKRLAALGYPVGSIDGKWGGMTAGGIAAFMNDREMTGDPLIDDALKVELTKAESEGFVRPIAKERAEADDKKVAELAPEVRPVATTKKVGFWGMIMAGFSAVTGWLSENFPTALSWIQQIKAALGEVPGYVWIGIFGVGAFAIYELAKRGKAGITQAVQKGERL